MILICTYCHRDFDRNGTIPKDSNHFCSRSCAVSYNNKKSPKRHPEGKCRICQTPIRTTARWCSTTCKEQERQEALDRRRKLRGPHVVAWRQRAKLKAITYKGGVCQTPGCGYSKSIRALAFHHLDPNHKDFAIGDGTGRSWGRIQAELDKCVLLCCRCHAEVHDGLLDVSNLNGNETL